MIRRTPISPTTSSGSIPFRRARRTGGSDRRGGRGVGRVGVRGAGDLRRRGPRPGAGGGGAGGVAVARGRHQALPYHRREVEARLALAQPSRQAALPWQRVALRTGMLPTVDQTKVVGLVSLPGAMTGMILAGASPLAAIRLQLLVMYMLLGGNAFAALVSGELTLRRLFTPDHQLIRTLRRTPL